MSFLEFIIIDTHLRDCYLKGNLKINPQDCERLPVSNGILPPGLHSLDYVQLLERIQDLSTRLETVKSSHEFLSLSTSLDIYRTMLRHLELVRIYTDIPLAILISV